MAEDSSSLDSWRLQLEDSNRRFYQNLVESKREFYKDLNDLRISFGMPPVMRSSESVVNQEPEDFKQLSCRTTAMTDGTKRRPFEDSIRKVESLLQRIHAIKTVNETPAIEASIQGIKAWSQEIESKPQFVENEVLESAEIERDIEEPNQDFEFKAISESFITAENLVLGESGVKLVDENEAKLVRVEGIATPSREMVDDTKDLQIQFELPKVTLCSPGFVVAEVASKGEDDWVNALTDPIKTGLPKMISVDILKIPVEYQMFVEVLEQGRALSSEFCKALERIGVAHKVFDKMSNEDLLSLSILSKNSNLESVDFDPGGMCCWTWFIDCCIGCEAMATQLILARKFVFDPGIASFSMELGESKLFVEIPKGRVLLFTASVEDRVITSEALSDQLACDSATSVVYSDIMFIEKGQISFPYDRGRVCVAHVEKLGLLVTIFDPGGGYLALLLCLLVRCKTWRDNKTFQISACSKTWWLFRIPSQG